MAEAQVESKSWMPQFVLRFYSKFPLVVLPAEDGDVLEKPDCPELWVCIPVASGCGAPQR
jgi:hypothetical protein